MCLLGLLLTLVIGGHGFELVGLSFQLGASALGAIAIPFVISAQINGISLPLYESYAHRLTVRERDPVIRTDSVSLWATRMC